MSDARVRIDVLGPIRAHDAEAVDCTPSGALQRRLLALLVLRRGQVVRADTAIDVLWPKSLPRDPSGALQNHMSRLRRGLPVGMIESVGDGYRLDPSAVDVDAERLADWLGDSASIDERRFAELDEVLERWQGPAYPELDELDDARAEALRLAELRVRAREVRAEHRLACGDTDGLVAELAALARDEPLRERPRSLLMSALAATGRHVEALRVYDEFRRLLGDELGIEPSPALSAQHAALLDRSATSPATTSGWVPTSRVPLPNTALIGRDALAREIASSAESHRLVLLVGPGGVGKTRLLVETGQLLRAMDPDRPVVLCELSTARADSVEDVVATSLGIDARPGVPLTDRVAAVLGDAAIVLLLDNCEHVLEPAAALVERLLAACARVTIVATSRERLRVQGERVCAIPPLAVDGRASPAVQLFVERARAVLPDFDPGPDDVATVEEIVRRLDGLPLAIELAAARLFTHDLHEVADGLDHRFELLSSGSRTSPRHASLGAAVSWSFDALDDELQHVFTTISVFAGSFTAADAAAVCDLGHAAATARLAELVERSLVVRTADRRFAMLETLRAFAAERLVASGRAEATRDRHARWLLAWVDEVTQHMVEADSTAIEQIDAAIPELHLAFNWLVERGDAARAGQLVTPLLAYALVRLRPDVLAWCERLLSIDSDDRSSTAALVWVGAAYAAWMQGDVPKCGERSRRALTVAERSDRPVPPAVFVIRGNYELFEGRLDEAARWHRQGVDAAIAAEDRGWQLIAAGTELLALSYASDPLAVERVDELLAAVGDARNAFAAYAWYCAGEAEVHGDVERAQDRFTRALELANATNASFVTGIAGASKASLEVRVGDLDAAARQYERLIDHWRRAGMWSTQWTMLRSIASLLFRRGARHDAAVLLGAINATGAGHRIFGADEIALRDLDRRLRDALGDEAYDSALAEGALLDGDTAVEHALRAL